MKKASKEGGTRLNVIRIVDAVIGKSRLKNKLTDKFGAFLPCRFCSAAL